MVVTPECAMSHNTRRWAIATAALMALCAAAWLAWRAFVPSEDALARRLETEFEARTGQALAVGQLRWRLLPQPSVEVLDVHTRQEQPIRVRRLTLYPQLWPLLHKRLVIDRLEIDGAEASRDALRALRGDSPAEDGSIELHRLLFSNLSYTSYAGIAVAYEGEVLFGEDRLLTRLEVRRPGAQPPATLEATREGRSDQGEALYGLRVQAAGGTAHGQARLSRSDAGGMRLRGELKPQDLEVQTLLDTFHRRSFISGRASGHTVLRAEGKTWGELARSLHTRSELTVQGGKILRFDVDKAVKSLGQEPAGQTPLDSLSGVVDTQNTEQGMKTEFTEVKAVAGSYSASGRATLYRKRLAAEGRLDIAGGALGVPFSAHGPVNKPEFKIAKGAIAGAAIGTVLLPGIGTAIGAQIGGALSGPPKPEKETVPLPRERIKR